MDPVIEIKSRLSIDALVSQYCQLQKKGRGYVCICPFHNDSRPSFLVSPDKGIGYCFACQKGGDIFSFYQLIENVDFPQAIRELAEKTGVVLESAAPTGPRRDEKERMRDCLAEVERFYRMQLQESAAMQQYLQERGVTQDERAAFGLGYAPDSFSATYEHLLRADFSRQEVVACGLTVQRDIDGKSYDRFRHRIMFPIRDIQGRTIGFGGRTMGGDDAKYVNSPDGALYHKSHVLFGLDRAKERMRETRVALVVEGYFDVLACHRVGATNTVAACGTALTEDHVRLLKRYVDTVILCLDMDEAGRAAGERAFPLLAKEGLQVRTVVLPQKDPADFVLEDADGLRALLASGGTPYIDAMIAAAVTLDLHEPGVKRATLAKILQLLRAIPSSLERAEYVRSMAAAFGVGVTELDRDLAQVQFEMRSMQPQAKVHVPSAEMFSATEIVLGLFFHYPQFLTLVEELIEPEEGFCRELYVALKNAAAAGVGKDPTGVQIDQLAFSVPAFLERARILALYFEQEKHRGMAEWGDNIARKEIRRNIHNANRELLRKKQQDIARKLADAQRAGDRDRQDELHAQYKQLLSIAKVTA